MCFQYNVQYKQGTQNVLADGLSRVPLADTSTTIHAEDELFAEIA